MSRISSVSTAIFLLFFNALWAGEIQLTGQGINIPDGDTTPRTTDGTDFGQLAAGGGTSTHTFVIRNEGATALQFVNLAVDGAAFDLLGAHPGVLIQPGGTKSFEVRFDPTSAGIKNGTVTILSNDSNEGTYTFSITGEGLGTPEIDVRGSQNGAGPWVTVLDGDTSPRVSDGTDFGDANVGASAISKTFQIHNTGDGQLTIDSITASNGNFTVAGVPATVGVNQNQTFTLNFSPLSVGTKDTTITIQNNDANEDPYTFRVTGEGQSPEIKIRGLNQLIHNGDSTPTTHDGTDFGQIAAGGGSITREFKIHNDGNTELNVSAILETASAFTITNTPNFATPITPGNSVSFSVNFNPTSAGVRTTTIVVRSDDPSDDPYEFEITGEGLGTPEILVQGQSNGTWVEILDGDTNPGAPDGTDFANATVGGSGKTRTFRIRNTGDAQLVIDSITDGSPHFSVASIPSVVGVNQTQTFTITFTPTSPGTHNTTINIQNNDPNEDPYTFSLTGVGRAPDIEVAGQGLVIANGDTTPRTQDGTDFGQIIAEAGMITRTFIIHNDGNTELNINAIVENGGAFSVSGNPTLAAPIPPGNSASFDVIFNPTSGGIKNATVQIRSDDPANDPYTFDVTGEGLGTPEIELRGRKNISSPWFAITKGATSGDSDRGTNFPGTLVNGGLSTATFQIRNTGGAQISINSITANSPEYVVASVPATVGVNQTQTFTIAFNPSSVGNAPAVVTVLSNDPDDSPFTFALDGLGLADGPALEVRGGPDVDLLYHVTHDWARYPGGRIALTVYELDCDHGEGRPINHGDTTPSLVDGTLFESRYFDSTPYQFIKEDDPPLRPTQFFRLRNSGDSDLTITGIAFTGADLIFPHNEWAPQVLGRTLPPGGCATLPVDFVAPLSLGGNTSTISITSNDPIQPLYQFGVSVTGLSTTYPKEMGVFGPEGDTLQNNASSIDFGLVTSSGGSNTRKIRIQNNGASQLSLSSIISDNSHFIVTPPTNTDLSFDEWVDVNITFSPTATGELNGTVTIQSNADNNPTFTLNVTGNAQGDGGIEPDPESELVIFGGSPMVRLLPEDVTPSPVDGTDAGTFEVGDEVTYSFRARNSGDIPFNFTRAPFIVGTQIKVTDLTPTLQPGEHDDFTLTFTPRNPGDYQLRLVLESDAPTSQFSFVIGATVNESPTIESAGIEIIGFTILDGDAYLNFDTPTGSTYRVVYSDNLQSPWTPVEEAITGGGFYSTFIADGGNFPKRYYRVEKE